MIYKQKFQLPNSIYSSVLSIYYGRYTIL